MHSYMHIIDEHMNDYNEIKNIGISSVASMHAYKYTKVQVAIMV